MKKRDKILCGVLVLSLIIGTAVPSRATIKDEKDTESAGRCSTAD